MIVDLDVAWAWEIPIFGLTNFDDKSKHKNQRKTVIYHEI